MSTPNLGLTVQGIQGTLKKHLDGQRHLADEDFLGEVAQVFSQLSWQVFWELDHATTELGYDRVYKDVIIPQLTNLIHNYNQGLSLGDQLHRQRLAREVVLILRKIYRNHTLER